MPGHRPLARSLSLTACVALLATTTGCAFPEAGPLPPPFTPADVDAAKTRFPTTDKTSLDAGRDLFASRCNGCHNYPDVWKIDDAHWPDIVKGMGKKAELDDAQSRSVLSFILVARLRPEPP